MSQVELSISQTSQDTYHVTVSGHTPTSHTVIVTESAHYQLTRNLTTKEELIKFSFGFLLNREPNTAILPSFEITLIEKYFKEFRDNVQKWCGF